MKCMKYDNGGGIDRPRLRRRNAVIQPSSSVNFGDPAIGNDAPRSCNPNAPANTPMTIGSGITVNKGGTGDSMAHQKAGELSSKRQLDSRRVISVKEMARKKEKERKQMMRAMRRSDKPQSNPRTLGPTSSFN